MASLRVFVSHSNKDNDWCEGFVAGLKNNGLDVWYDRQGLYVGAEWVKTLEQEIQGRDIYLIVLTPDAWASQWVQRELSLALGQQKRIIGVLCKPTQVSGFITNYQLLDATRLDSKQAAQLVAAALNGAKPASSPPTSAPQPAQVAARTSLIDIAGEWKEPKQHYNDKDGLQLVLKQAGTKITGLGKISGLSLTISGTIDGTSVKLRATPMEESYYFPYSYLELDLTFEPPDEMRGQEIGYEGRKGGFIFSKEKFHVKDFRNLTLFNEEKMDPSLYANIGRS